MPYREFIVLMALLMAMTAMSIDIMLPALPEIGTALGAASDNDRQGVVIVYMLGLAGGQLFWGPLSDRLGRRTPLLAGLFLFVAATAVASLSTSFTMLLAARLVQGFGGGAARTIATAVVRDLFQGRDMARILSTIMMVFIMVPVFAPAVGQIAIGLGTWRWAFYVLFVAGATAAIWSWVRLPETRPPQFAGPLSLAGALRLVLGQRVTVAYGIATGLTFGCLVTYISSAQQVFVDIYGLGRLFPLAFGGIASAMALAALTNALLVQRLGMRRLSHTAIASFLAISLLLVIASLATRPPLAVVAPLLAACFYLFGLIQSNFNAIAMQPVGRAAGTAASLLGFFTTTTGAIIGGLIARQFDGTVTPLAVGFATLSACALLVIFLVEGRGGMFRGD